MIYDEEVYEAAKMAAIHSHQHQSYDIFPYEFHLRKVVNIIKGLGLSGKYICAAWLHDAVEDGNLSYSKIKRFFGKEVAEMVYGVTDGDGRTRSEKKSNTYPKTRANIDAVIIKLADRLANISQSVWTNNFKKMKMYREEHDDFINGIVLPEYKNNQYVAKLMEMIDAKLENVHAEL